MNNYFMLNGRKIPLTDEQAEEIKTSLGLKEKQLKDIPVGDTFKAGDYEFIVFEQMGEKTAVILKNLLHENVKFGKNNNYNGSNADNTCISFVQKIADIIGKDNIYEHEVDLTSANGMTCYGKITRRMSLLTLERLQKYGHILAKHKVEKWWWLATANGTKKCGTDEYAFCVAPSGGVFNSNYYNDNGGVRPFCILNSNIFVSE